MKTPDFPDKPSAADLESRKARCWLSLGFLTAVAVSFTAYAEYSIGETATGGIPEDMAGGFHKIPIEVVDIAPDVYQVMGIGNAHIIATPAGNVMFDTGIAFQAAQQIKVMRDVEDGPISHIILSHSHADHIGGTRFWQEKDTEIIAHREFVEEQRYLTELEPYLHHRNRAVFPWMPAEPTQVELFKYGGIEPTITVDEKDYKFVHGGIQFEVLSTPGAEGADNISLWLPEKKNPVHRRYSWTQFSTVPECFHHARRKNS